MTKKPLHYLTARDLEAMNATCSECGPVRMVKSGKAIMCEISRRESSGRTRMKMRYGLEPGDYEIWWMSEGGACGICRKEVPLEGDERGPLHVDHDHDTGLVRGLLCFQCNTGLGQFRDDADVMRRAAEYIECRKTPAPTST